ncbi:hypothetical protein DZJ_13330 [Dickeya ananatis]
MRHDIGRVQKRRLIQTNIDEGSLHPRQHTANATFINIADNPAPGFTFNMDFLQDAAVNIGNTRF